MKKFRSVAILATTALLASLVAATPASAAPGNSSSDQPGVLRAAEASPLLAPGTIALCNSGFGEVSVQRYDNAKGLGAVDLRCGDANSGYVHIRARHQGEWQSRINSVGRGGNWDDLMAWATGEALRAPKAGYPKNVGSGKYCYSTPIFMSGPRGTVQFNPTVVVSTNNKRVITSYPTTNPAC